MLPPPELEQAEEFATNNLQLCTRVEMINAENKLILTNQEGTIRFVLLSASSHVSTEGVPEQIPNLDEEAAEQDNGPSRMDHANGKRSNLRRRRMLLSH